MKNTPIIKASHDDVIDHIVGMTEEQAIRTLKLNGENHIRIAEKNGKAHIYSMQLWIGVYLHIEDDKVIKATRG